MDPQRGAAGGSAPARDRFAGIAVVALAVLAMALGIVFRFYHIDRKVYWGDEAYTSLRILGRLESDLIARAPQFRQVRD